MQERKTPSKGRAIMELNKAGLERLLALNDAQLIRVLSSLAAEYGIDTSGLSLGKKDIEKLRAVLSAATDEDIKNFMENASRLKNFPPMG